jgi:putative tricarboxylic transport membrane protein
VVDLWLMFGAGLAGYLLEKLEVPLAPIVLGMILGPMAEQGVRRALLIGRGDPLHLVSSPLSMIIAAATVGFILWPLLRRLKSTRRSDR